MSTEVMAQRAWQLLVIVLCLVTFGTIMIGSAAIALNGTYLQSHLLYLVIATLAGTVCFAIPPWVWDRFYLLGWVLACLIAIAVLIPGVGHEVNGASRWIRLGGFSLQAAEIAKFGICIYLAGYLARYAHRINEDAHTLMLPLAMIVVVCALLIAEPDLGSAVVIVLATVLLLFVAGARLRYFFAFAAVGAASLALLIWIEPYRMQRFVAFLDPWAVQFGSGYQLTQALIAFGRGELVGLGLGEGIQKLFYLPEAHTDFIFAVVGEEFGSFGAILLSLVLAALVWYLLQIGRSCVAQHKAFPGYAAYFVGLLICIQSLVSLGVNTGVLPTKGLTLPFISYGGNSLIVFCSLLGIVLRGVLEERHG